MSTIIELENGYKVVDPTPTGAGGIALNDNFTKCDETAGTVALIDANVDNLLNNVSNLMEIVDTLSDTVASKANESDLTAHTGDTSNPHGVTAAQAGAVPTSRTISTTAPLSGGGALTGNLTLSVGAATTSAAGTMSAADKSKLDAFSGSGDVSAKADKIVPAAASNFAALNASGNLIDSTHKHADYAAASTVTTHVADTAAHGATSTNTASRIVARSAAGVINVSEVNAVTAMSVGSLGFGGTTLTSANHPNDGVPMLTVSSNNGAYLKADAMLPFYFACDYEGGGPICINQGGALAITSDGSTPDRNIICGGVTVGDGGLAVGAINIVGAGISGVDSIYVNTCQAGSNLFDSEKLLMVNGTNIEMQGSSSINMSGGNITGVLGIGFSNGLTFNDNGSIATLNRGWDAITLSDIDVDITANSGDLRLNETGDSVHLYGDGQIRFTTGVDGIAFFGGTQTGPWAHAIDSSASTAARIAALENLVLGYGLAETVEEP